MKSSNYKCTTRLQDIALAMACFLLLTNSCENPPESHDPQKQLIENERVRLRDSIQLQGRYQDSIIKLLVGCDSAMRQIRRSSGAKEKELQVSRSTAKRLRNELREYRSMDTAAVYAKIDSLLAETESLAYLLGQYMVAYESLSDSVAKKDSISVK